MNMHLDSNLIVTVLVLVAEVVLLVFCRYKLRQPVNPRKPRLIPYGAIMIFLSLGIFVTLAHTVSLVTGKTLAPKTSSKIR